MAYVHQCTAGVEWRYPPHSVAVWLAQVGGRSHENERNSPKEEEFRPWEQEVSPVNDRCKFLTIVSCMESKTSDIIYQ